MTTLEDDKTAIDQLVAEFFGAFDNRAGGPADVGRLRRLMLPGGVIVATGEKYSAFTVEEFVGPRELLLSDGRLVGFAEWETSEQTELMGDVACRFGTYRKSGTLNGEPYEGGGHKTFQLVRTPDGWRIAAFSWYDHD
ncbi:YybH family protein [Kitasatospora viridis]|uniref:Uncharacterized protein DUF4440 n=1 Tax=Kitasatospora viridis TaxID=281105 RepID=A0A561TT67_9ACTN|nr:nuclear transport factor 2 family protein [Kitasatospora viridis]TWF90301.1 uncharacterized protein DUF4440 [Kitasatospora viridis]